VGKLLVWAEKDSLPVTTDEELEGDEYGIKTYMGQFIGKR
jgi:hypothetical protein